MERLCRERAERHHSTVLLRRCFTAWHDHYRLALRKMVSSKGRSKQANSQIVSYYTYTFEDTLIILVWSFNCNSQQA